MLSQKKNNLSRSSVSVILHDTPQLYVQHSLPAYLTSHDRGETESITSSDKLSKASLPLTLKVRRSVFAEFCTSRLFPYFCVNHCQISSLQHMDFTENIYRVLIKQTVRFTTLHPAFYIILSIIPFYPTLHKVVW